MEMIFSMIFGIVPRTETVRKLLKEKMPGVTDANFKMEEKLSD